MHSLTATIWSRYYCQAHLLRRWLKHREPKWLALGHTADAPDQSQDSGPSYPLGSWAPWTIDRDREGCVPRSTTAVNGIKWIPEVRHLLFLSLRFPHHLQGSVTTILYHSSLPLVTLCWFSSLGLQEATRKSFLHRNLQLALRLPS